MRIIIWVFIVTFSFPRASAEDENLETLIISAATLPITKLHTVSAVSQLREDTLRLVSATHPNEFAAIMPGAWVSRGDGQEHLTAIRSPVFTGAGACSAFFVGEDSIATRSPGFCNVNQLFDTHYEQAQVIEVFRGPNSVVFGNNALFGGVNMLTPDQSAGEFIRLDVGSEDYTRVALNTLNKNEDFRLFATVTDTDSFRDNAGYSQQKLGLKSYLQLGQWQVDSTLQLNNLEQETAGFIEGFDAYKNDSLRTSNAFPEAYRDAQSIRGNSRWFADLEHGTFLVQPYFRAHKMEFLMHFVPWQPTENNEHYSLGLKLASRQQVGSRFSVLAGFDFDYSIGSLSEFQNDPAPFAQQVFPLGAHYDYDVAATSISPYIDIDIELSKKWVADFQFRWESLRYDYRNQLDDGAACGDAAPACRFYRPQSRKDTFRSPAWQLGLIYQLSARSNFFAKIATAYRAPHTSELYRLQSPLQTELENVQLNSAEIGFRHVSKYWRYELIAFSMQQSDAIYLNTQREYLTNSETEHSGVEYEIEWFLNDRLNLGLVGSFAEHRYANSPDLLGVDVDIEGNLIDTAPKNLFAFTGRWRYSSGEFFGSLTVIDDYFLDPQNRFRYEGHTLFNTTWRQDLNPNTSFMLRVKNLFNERYAERADYAFGDYRYFPGASRSIYLTLNYSL